MSLCSNEVIDWFRPDYYWFSKATSVILGFCGLHALLILMFYPKVKAFHVTSKNQIQ